MNSEGLADELIEQVRGKRVLLIQADRGREMLRERLASVAQVDCVAAYRQLEAIDTMQPLDFQARFDSVATPGQPPSRPAHAVAAAA